MKHAKRNRHLRVKAVAIAVAALAVGIGLLILSRVVIASGEKAAAEAARATEVAKTQPAADAPGDPADPSARPEAPEQQAGSTNQSSEATGTATAPAGSPAAPAGRVPPVDPKAVTAQRMGGLLLLFSLMSFALVIICIGWIIYDIRRSRPAWMRQTKYPVHDRRK